VLQSVQISVQCARVKMTHFRLHQRLFLLFLCFILLFAMPVDSFSTASRQATRMRPPTSLNKSFLPRRSSSQTFESTKTRLGMGVSSSSSSKITPGIGEEGCKLPSPSGVNVMEDSTQAAIFLGILVALGVCTSAFNTLLASLTNQFEWFQSFRYSWPIALGLVFMAAGVTHFTVAQEYKNIYPYRGAWGGLWELPGSADFHVAWTGVAELVGGTGLLAGGLIDWLAPVYLSSPNIVTAAGLESDCAAALYLLTWAVTPANIFMFTHGAKLPMEVEGDVPISFHVVRFVMQVVLLGFLYQMGEGTFEALMG
jgi:uncharacterized membrane protein